MVSVMLDYKQLNFEAVKGGLETFQRWSRLPSRS